MRSVNFLSWMAAALLAGLFSGCAHYQLGTEGKLTFHSLYVEPVKDSANIPQATALFSTHLRDALLRDGRLTLATSPDSADVTLQVDLRNYGRRVATVRRDDTGLARSFDIEVEAVCTLHDNRSGQNLFEKRPVNATREIFTSDAPTEVRKDIQDVNGKNPPIFISRQIQAEYQTLPLLASALADRVAHAVVDVW